MQGVRLAVFVGMLLFVSSVAGGELQAYLDPGTGSVVMQVVLGGIVGGLAFARLYWRKVKAFVFRQRGSEEGSLGD